MSDDSVMQGLAKLADEKIKWHWEPTMIAGQESRLAVASDPDGMLIEACERQDAGEEGVIDPFWAATWRAASGLDHYLERIDLSGMRVLELGCGTGHAGLAAAMRGANVVLTDGVNDPLMLVRMSTLAVADRCRVERLRFGLDRLDDPKFPLILGSDVTYLRALWPELDQCLRDHLADGGEVLLSDPFRFIANEFRDWIQGQGWDYTEHKIELADDPEHPIRVMQLRLAD
ncbi:class I SAM-dependent methyltransferase [Rubripirellula reticaptiva]|uniref:Putative methyltransferase n=1 Tax=Rubripirellula reticaptiva TaxID=2528013 RepID=A0A5C6FC53_9BACT|nr:protein N-lysine methyltransferase family protein [Rubripirellula reticaptiva]TWU57151.1 putative methyltransferase [Rubripirellula reticaptiva]